MTLIPYGIDKDTGEGRPGTGGEPLEGSDGLPIAGGTPTTSNYVVNEEALDPLPGGLKVLTDVSPVVHIFSADAFGVSPAFAVQLPPTSPANPIFFFVNEGLHVITVLDVPGNRIWDLRPDEGVRLLSTGSRWMVHSAEKWGNPIRGQNYTFGGDVGGVGFLIANTSGLTGIGTPIHNAVGTYHTIHETGFVDQITWISNSDTLQGTLQFYSAGGVIPDNNIRIAGRTGTLRVTTPFLVSQGAQLSIEALSNLPELQVSVRVRNAASGYIVYFSGNPTVADAFYRAGGHFDATTDELAEDQHSQVQLIGSGNLLALSYSVKDALNTDSVDLLHNGVPVVVTFTLGGTVGPDRTGIEPITPIPFVDGDTLAIRTNNELTNDALFGVLTDAPGMSYHFSGNPGSGQGYQAWGRTASVGGVALDDNDGYVVAQKRGEVHIGWRNNAAPTGGLGVYRVSMGASQADARYDISFVPWNDVGFQGTFNTKLIVEPGDLIGLYNDDGSGGQGNIFVVIL